MTEIGYYNYYNDPTRYTTDKVIDRYQQMVDRYNSDELHASNSDPYSERNLALRKLDEQLAPMAESVRSQCETIDDVRHYLGLKYFGQEEFGYTMKWKEPEKYAMYKNDLNAICYGTVSSANLNDPRLNYTEKDWETYESEEKASKQKIISNQMANLMQNNGIELSENDSLLISFDPYSYAATVEGSSDLALMSKLMDALNNGSNSKQLMYYTMQNTQDLNSDSLAKFRAYQEVKQYTGEDLSNLTLKDGEYYLSDGTKLSDYLKDAIDNDDSIGLDFKPAAYNNIMEHINTVAEKGWSAIENLNLNIGYSKNDGFYLLGGSWEA